jgi:tRNA (cytidine56-2'-O)-methyltransferase
MNVNVLRLDHRIGRDTRITTHVCLTSRAFGASKIYLSSQEDTKLMDNVIDIVNRWGGDFQVEYIKNFMELILKWREDGGKIVHLTMYGSQANEKINEIKKSLKDILIIVGGPKVPTEVFENADWNISITNQPHSEVSSLGVFQHLLMDGKEFDLEFENPLFEVIPDNQGKNVNVHKN